MAWGVVGAAAIGAIGTYAGGASANNMAASESGRGRAWQKDMYKHRYQYTVKDMRKAGLNPILAAQFGGGSSPSGMQASFQNPAAGAFSTAADIYSAGKQGEVADVNIQKVEQEVRNLESSQNLTDEQTRAMSYTIDEIKSRIDINASKAQGVDYDNIEKAVIAHWAQSNQAAVVANRYGMQPQTVESIVKEYFSRFGGMIQKLSEQPSQPGGNAGSGGGY